MGESRYSNRQKTCAICVKYFGNRCILDHNRYSYILETAKTEGNCVARNLRVKAQQMACSQFKPIPEFDF